MARHDYRLLVAAATAPQTITDEARLTSVQFSRALNGAGTFTGMVPVDARAKQLRSSSAPSSTVVWIDRDGSLVWGGFLWTRKYDSRSGMVQVGGSDFISYLARRLVLTRSWAAVDQFQIVRDVVADMQSVAGGNIALQVTNTNCAKNRDLAVRRQDGRMVFDVLKSLADATDGFDFSLDYVYNGGLPQATLRLDYPYRGRLIGVDQLVYDFPGSVLRYLDPEDGSAQANRIFAVGGLPTHIDGFAVMSASIAAGATITSIAVQPMSYAAPLGFQFPYGTQTMRLSAAVAVGATALPVDSITTLQAFPGGQVIGTFAGPPLMAQMSADILLGSVGVTSIAVAALTMSFPAGYTFPYGDMTLQLTSAVAAGAVALPVQAFTPDRSFLNGTWIGQTQYGMQNIARLTGSFYQRLSAAVPAGTPVSTLPVEASLQTQVAGTAFPYGTNTVTLSADVHVGDLVLNVNTFTPAQSWPAHQVIGTFAVKIGTTYAALAVEAMTVTLDQGDTFPFGSLTLTVSAPVALGATSIPVSPFVAIEAWPAGQIIGRNTKPLQTTYRYLAPVADGYPALDALMTWTDIVDQFTLNAKARYTGEHLAVPLRLLEADVRTDLPVDIQLLVVGDEVQYDIDDQWQTVSLVQRVIDVRVDLDPEGNETAHLISGPRIPSIVVKTPSIPLATTLIADGLAEWWKMSETTGLAASFGNYAPDGITGHPNPASPTASTILGVAGGGVDGLPGVGWTTVAGAPTTPLGDQMPNLFNAAGKAGGFAVKAPVSGTGFGGYTPDAGGGYCWSLTVNATGGLRFQSTNTDISSGAGSLMNGAWHFVVFASASGTGNVIRLYIDGVLVLTAAGSGGGPTGGVNCLGASCGGMQDIIIKNGDLTDADVAQIWNSYKGL